MLDECLVNPSVATASIPLSEVPPRIILKTLFVAFCAVFAVSQIHNCLLLSLLAPRRKPVPFVLVKPLT
jgi:hypothetical protein